MARKIQGFTLTELSISIVVIGILTGLVVVSTSLLGSARLRTVITESQDHKSSYDLFKERFKFAAGDFPGGSRYWGANCQSTGTGLCDGNGDYLINDAGISTAGSEESLVFWRHLENAGLTKGSYTGLAGSGGNCSSANNCATEGLNIPSSQWGDNTGWYIISGTTETALILGQEANNSWNSDPHMTPQESQFLDVKTDDGNPITGSFRAVSITGATLTNASTCLSSNAFDLSITANVCGAVFVID